MIRLHVEQRKQQALFFCGRPNFVFFKIVCGHGFICWFWGLILGHHACKTGTLLLEVLHQSSAITFKFVFPLKFKHLALLLRGLQNPKLLTYSRMGIMISCIKSWLLGLV
jgi:hypothetical protein